MALFSRKARDSARPPVPFIVGVGRSGTTMLRLMLDAHPDLAIPPETHFVPELIDAIDGGATPEQAATTMIAVRQWGDLDTDPEDVVARWRQLERFESGPALHLREQLPGEPTGSGNAASRLRRRDGQPPSSQSRGDDFSDSEGMCRYRAL